MTEITEFRGPHSFLSNFHTGPVAFAMMSLGYGGAFCVSGEHAYQAHKAQDPARMAEILAAPTPAEAKRLGRACVLPPWWESRKKQIMLDVLLAKFSQPDLRQQLVSTGDAVLIEGNTWGDTYWGAVRYGARGFSSALPYWHLGVKGPLDCGNDLLAGHNWLGRELMMVREVLA